MVFWSRYSLTNYDKDKSINEETGVLDGELQTIKSDLYDITGVEIYDANTGELRSTYDIISDIADVYDSLTDRQKYKVLDLLGGKRQINQVSAILNNFDIRICKSTRIY